MFYRNQIRVEFEVNKQYRPTLPRYEICTLVLNHSSVHLSRYSLNIALFWDEF